MNDTDVGPKHKGYYLLPNLLTTASLFSGFLAMVWAINSRFEHSALAILASALFDGLDGKVARLTRSQSMFGIQFDSLSDLVAFGVAPAVTVFLWQTQQFGRVGLLASFLFLACTALRLARFNVQVETTPSKFFTGMPSPASACTLATLILFVPYVSEFVPEKVLAWSVLFIIYLLSFLMVSRIKYHSFKDVGMVRSHPYGATATMILLFVLVASEPKLLGFLFFLGYLISGILYTFLLYPLRRSTRLGGPTRELY